MQHLAERIRSAVAEQELACPDGSVSLNCSIGVTLTSDPADSVDALIRKADSALYDAKRAGRNQVAWHDDAEPRGR